MDQFLYQTKEFSESLKESDVISLKDYLRSKKLTPAFPLVTAQSLYFHWADWKKSVDFKKKNSCHDIDNDEIIKYAKSVTVWIRTGRKIKSSNLLELHHLFIKRNLNSKSISLKETEVSFTNSTGPYNNFEKLDWFNKELFLNLVFDDLLHENIPQRKFRVKIDAKLEGKIDLKKKKKVDFSMTQIGHKGLLFIFENEKQLKKILKNGFFYIGFDLEKVHELDLKDLAQLKKDLNFTSKGLFWGNVDACGTCYKVEVSSEHIIENTLFADFDKISSLSDGQSFKEGILDFLKKIEAVLDYEMAV